MGFFHPGVVEILNTEGFGPLKSCGWRMNFSQTYTLRRALGLSYGVHTGHVKSLQTNWKEFKIFTYYELSGNSGSNREPIGKIGKNSSSGKKLEWDASYRVLTPTNTDWVKWSHKFWENTIREIEVSGAKNINYKNTYINLFGELRIKRSKSLDID
jgi:hypothetical protein